MRGNSGKRATHHFGDMRGYRFEKKRTKSSAIKRGTDDGLDRPELQVFASFAQF